MDLFEHYEELPQEVQDVIMTNEGDFDYKECQEFVEKLNKLGYTCDYYLDAECHSLRKIVKVGETYTYGELGIYSNDVGLNEAEFTREEKGEWEVGKHTIEFTKKDDDSVKMKFVLEGLYAGSSIYKCIETAFDLEYLEEPQD